MNLKQDKPDVVRIRLGSLEKDVDNFPSAHIFVNSMANWDKINDDLPQYEFVTEE